MRIRVEDSKIKPLSTDAFVDLQTLAPGPLKPRTLTD